MITHNAQIVYHEYEKKANPFPYFCEHFYDLFGLLRKKQRCLAASLLRLYIAQFLVAVVGGDDAVHGGAPESLFLQSPDAGNGAAAGGADRIL